MIQSAKSNHSQLAGTVPEKESDTTRDGTGRKDTDTNDDITVEDVFLGESGNYSINSIQVNEDNNNSQSSQSVSI